MKYDNTNIYMMTIITFKYYYLAVFVQRLPFSGRSEHVCCILRT